MCYAGGCQYVYVCVQTYTHTYIHSNMELRDTAEMCYAGENRNNVNLCLYVCMLRCVTEVAQNSRGGNLRHSASAHTCIQHIDTERRYAHIISTHSCTHAYTHILAHMHTHTFLHTCIHTHSCTHAYTHSCTHAYTHILAHIQEREKCMAWRSFCWVRTLSAQGGPSLHAQGMCVCVWFSSQVTAIHTYIHIYTYIHTHIYIYTYIHT